MEIKTNTAIEVTKSQYDQIGKHLGGICARRTAKGKFYIKLMYTKEIFKFYLKEILNG